MDVDVEAALREAGRRGLLRDGESYPKRALIEAFVATGLSPLAAERAFFAVREASSSEGSVGAFGTTSEGAGSRRRYVFEGLPAGKRAASSGRPPASSEPETAALGDVTVHFGDNLAVLRELEDATFDLIYIDPPFNTGKVQARTRIRNVRDGEHGDRTGFQGQRYRSIEVGTKSFADDFDDFLEFIEPRLIEAKRLLKPTGSFFLHIDYREVHYCKVLLDRVFGRGSFVNEIIWAYDYGARSKRKWSTKHDNILWYAKDPKDYTFNFDEMDRIPYMAPGLVGAEKAARGKTPTDVWWHTIVPTNGKERTGYPTQKPLGVLNRILRVHSNPGDAILDFFAGSGTTAEAAARLGRHCTLIDSNAEAMEVIARRLAFATPTFNGWPPPDGGAG